MPLKLVPTKKLELTNDQATQLAAEIRACPATDPQAAFEQLQCGLSRHDFFRVWHAVQCDATLFALPLALPPTPVPEPAQPAPAPEPKKRKTT